MENDEITIVVVGESVVGKSCLCAMFVENHFPDEYVPTVTEYAQGHVTLDGETIKVEVQDTAGSNDFDRLRLMQYAKADVIVIVFSLDYEASIDNVSRKWAPEVKHAAPSKPFLLVGNKCDLRKTLSPTEVIDHATGVKLSESIGAECYMETSALENINIQNMFAESVRAALRARLPKKKKKKKTVYYMCCETNERQHLCENI